MNEKEIKDPRRQRIMKAEAEAQRLIDCSKKSYEEKVEMVTEENEQFVGQARMHKDILKYQLDRNIKMAGKKVKKEQDKIF